MDLSRLMRPRSVAVVGATDRPASYGAQALLNLEAVGYTGPVWGVNPRRTEVLGRPWTSVRPGLTPQTGPGKPIAARLSSASAP